MNSYSYACPTARGQTGFTKPSAFEGFVGKAAPLPENPKLAMAYVPFQTNSEAYDEMKALRAGTLFPCLDKPFLGSGTR